MSVPSPSEVLRSVAQELAARGACAYLSTGTYPSSLTSPALFLGALQADPVLAVALAHYDTSTAQDSHNPHVKIQLRWRAPKLGAVEDLAYAGFRALHFFERHDPPRVYPGGLDVQRCTRIITAPAERDATGKAWERADSYLLILNP